MPKVVTRFAPSPTGFLHIGGARTALYNWLFARHHGGDFLLRIEDTDLKRSTDEAIDAILAGMRWLGLDWDGTAISQASRANRHQEVALAMLKNGKAYRCYASAEELTEAREAARTEGRNFRGDLWRDRDASEAPEGAPYAVRIKMPREGEVTIRDAVQGDVTVKNSELDDMIILRSDGTPTYMLAVVVDDHDMGVTHIIRGDDHLNNAFRQYQIYEAMEWDVPVFAHIPLIHGPDGKKLSKRHGALGVEAYEEMGFLPEAMRNYLLRLGWSHGDDEIISTEDAIKWFNLESVGCGPARFDFDKLDNLNGHYIREADADRLLSIVKSELENNLSRTLEETEVARLSRALPSLAERAKRLPELTESASLFCNTRPLDVTDNAAKQLTGDALPVLEKVANELEAVTEWSAPVIKAAIMSFAEAEGLKLGKVMQPIRAAVTGGKQSGDLVETLEILGQGETIGRLRDRVAA
ncbi:glutamate--tRNA ligase [Kordiimonas aestuarii]|uniref:glutamate--tRNA ligase n=1 Tax=Kordiimonas aestuarii TaxID=1005925 RepID=UPI0021D20F25|nr:glutamate--tRNA ligase [Kordiimonas aestuarii]